MLANSDISALVTAAIALDQLTPGLTAATGQMLHRTYHAARACHPASCHRLWASRYRYEPTHFCADDIRATLDLYDHAAFAAPGFDSTPAARFIDALRCNRELR